MDKKEMKEVSTKSLSTKYLLFVSITECICIWHGVWQSSVTNWGFHNLCYCLSTVAHCYNGFWALYLHFEEEGVGKR